MTLWPDPQGVTARGTSVLCTFSPSLQAPLPPLGKAKLGSAGGSKKGLPPLKRALPASPAAAAAETARPIGGMSASASVASIVHQQSLAVPERVGGRTSPGNLSRESSPEPQRKQWGDAKPLSLGMAGAACDVAGSVCIFYRWRFDEALNLSTLSMHQAHKHKNCTNLRTDQSHNHKKNCTMLRADQSHNINIKNCTILRTDQGHKL